MSGKIKVWVHRVVVFSKPAPQGKKVRMHTYIAPKTYMVREWFNEDHPEQEIVKLFSIGLFQAEMEREEYNAIRN